MRKWPFVCKCVSSSSSHTRADDDIRIYWANMLQTQTCWLQASLHEWRNKQNFISNTFWIQSKSIQPYEYNNFYSSVPKNMRLCTHRIIEFGKILMQNTNHLQKKYFVYILYIFWVKGPTGQKSIHFVYILYTFWTHFV